MIHRYCKKRITLHFEHVFLFTSFSRQHPSSWPPSICVHVTSLDKSDWPANSLPWNYILDQLFLTFDRVAGGLTKTPVYFVFKLVLRVKQVLCIKYFSPSTWWSCMCPCMCHVYTKKIDWSVIFLLKNNPISLNFLVVALVCFLLWCDCLSVPPDDPLLIYGFSGWFF